MASHQTDTSHWPTTDFAANELAIQFAANDDNDDLLRHLSLSGSPRDTMTSHSLSTAQQPQGTASEQRTTVGRQQHQLSQYQAEGEQQTEGERQKHQQMNWAERIDNHGEKEEEKVRQEQAEQEFGSTVNEQGPVVDGNNNEPTISAFLVASNVVADAFGRPELLESEQTIQLTVSIAAQLEGHRTSTASAALLGGRGTSTAAELEIPAQVLGSLLQLTLLDISSAEGNARVTLVSSGAGRRYINEVPFQAPESEWRASSSSHETQGGFTATAFLIFPPTYHRPRQVLTKDAVARLGTTWTVNDQRSLELSVIAAINTASADDSASAALGPANHCCRICLQPYQVGDELTALPCARHGCGSVWHLTCIHEWLNQGPKPTCPLCRQQVPEESDESRGSSGQSDDQ